MVDSRSAASKFLWAFYLFCRFPKIEISEDSKILDLAEFGGFRNLGMKILIESRRSDLGPVPAFRSSFTNNQVRNDAGPVALSRSSYVLESSASHQIILY